MSARRRLCSWATRPRPTSRAPGARDCGAVLIDRGTAPVEAGSPARIYSLDDLLELIR